MALLLSGIMIVLLLLGFPMLVPLLAATVVGLLAYFPDVSPEVVIQQMIGGVKPSALIAVPMFILAAEIMTSGQTSNRLLSLVESFVGHLRGGLAVTSAVACTLFGAISGSSSGSRGLVVAVAPGYPASMRFLHVARVADCARSRGPARSG